MQEKDNRMEYIRSSKRNDGEDYYVGYYPPPWSLCGNGDKTEGWIAFQEAQRRDPDRYKPLVMP